MGDLNNKRIFVTGGSKGLGLEICQALLNSNARVVTCARSKTSKLEDFENKFGKAFTFIPADLSNEESVLSLIDQAGLITQPYDGFVANAAIGADGLLTMMPKAGIQQALNVNLYSVILLTQAVLKGLLASQTSGSIVFISSVCAHRGFNGLSVYSATKAGLCGFSKSIAREYGKRRIRSNVVLPGFLETEMTQNLQSKQTDSIRRRTPLNRLGKSSDIVKSVLHLLSNESDFTTGSEVTIDGGLTL
ncbi:MAG: SDR family oxidoreductase [Verrucomicrobia bacterium]|jgi:3-oxoacyl-[acyl-carrier protein] reductase|nr:SDR family oxidoreductase [Verrucomicrobiota bacterium]